MEKLARRSRVQTVTNKNTPRSIRSRLSFPRRKAPAEEAAVPDSPTQQVVRSSSGKMALGPWLGSFGSMEDMGGLLDQQPPSPTLFATSQGRVFADLAGAPVAASDLHISAVEVAPAGAAPSHPEDPRGGRRALERQAAALKNKGESGRGHRSGGLRRAPRANVAVRRYRMIGQARKAN